MTGSTTPAGLVATDITVTIAGRALVDHASLTAPSGTLTALIGANGAGKSTLLRAIAGVGARSAGSVALDGEDLGALPRRERARRLAFVAQDAGTELAITAREIVELGRTPFRGLLGGGDAEGGTIVEAAFERAGAAELRDRIFGTLSGGERQRVLLARALAQQPRALVLDEPTNHLDISAQFELLDLLADLAADGLVVLAALHDLPLAARAAGHVVALRQGRTAAAGAPRDVLDDSLVRHVYGDGVTAAWAPDPLRPGHEQFVLAPRAR